LGGKRFFIPFHPEHARELGNDKAELYFEYLKFCQGKGDGAIKSVIQIQKELGMKRAVQERARLLLVKKGWLFCGVVSKRSPTNKYRILM
jgi:hypothetical protein